MDRAAARIAEAVKNSQRIVLIGDYDVDGVVSTAIFRIFFEALGTPLLWKIPNRFRDGYGLSAKLIDHFDDVDLIITVDNGISAHDAARECRNRGIDLIITDHHIVPDSPPPAYAVINPKQPACRFPYEEICGAQIAWYLCAALKKKLNADVDMAELLELVSLAIISDIMPLQHINRAMLINGLKRIGRSRRPAFQAYREKTGKEISGVEDIAFGLGPVLNSAGRIEEASVACDFLCSTDLREARRLLGRLMEFNEQRRNLEKNITQEAIRCVDPDAPILLAVGNGWHEGVIGIVAARLARHFEKPALVFARTGDRCKGSGRSFAGCDLFSLLKKHSGVLEKFGGHRAAVGLTIRCDMLEKFEKALIPEASEQCSSDCYKDPDILGELPKELIGEKLYDLLVRYEPYGQGNPRPKFVTRKMEILSARQLGTEKNHLKLLLDLGGRTIEAIQFHTHRECREGEFVDLLYTLRRNSFNGRTSLQLRIEKILSVSG